MEYGLISAEELEERRIFEEWEKREREEKMEGGVKVECVLVNGERGSAILLDTRIYQNIQGDWYDITPFVEKWEVKGGVK